MKRLGLIGGISPESTEIYVRLLNNAARQRLGGEHSANFICWYLDYAVMIGLYRKRDWPRFIDEVVAAGEGLKRAGADALMIGSNTTHLAADALAEATGLPVIHLQDALAAAMKAAKSRRPLLMGTPVVMSGEFYGPALAARYDGAPVIPDAGEQRDIERIILEELCFGVVNDRSRAALLDIVAAHPDCDGVILGCTELSMILAQDHCDIPVFDTTALHAAAGTAFAFGEEP
jgi:aspartate racemase